MHFPNYSIKTTHFRLPILWYFKDIQNFAEWVIFININILEEPLT